MNAQTKKAPLKDKTIQNENEREPTPEKTGSPDAPSMTPPPETSKGKAQEMEGNV